MVIAEDIEDLTVGTFPVHTFSFMSGMCHTDGDKLILDVLALTGGLGFYMWCMFPHVLRCIVVTQCIVFHMLQRGIACGRVYK